MQDINFLDKINNPSDIKSLSPEELTSLSREIRGVLIDVVSANGGHLASNLGAVELTLALHKVFDSPRDKIIFDVGHQSYTHKLLTGRYSRFSTLRTENGISGFCRPDESEHDPLFSGHSSTSVSSAFGIASANKIKGDGSFAVAVVGDGSFTGGLVYEALNNAGRTDSRLIVVLNDNEMSISQNVGSIARYLAIISSKRSYFRFKAGTEKLLNHIPLIGHALSELAYKLKITLKNIIYKSNLFEDMGFRYMGPLDGHDIGRLAEAFETAKLVGKPVLIHINTRKGKGYELAEQRPTQFHGVSRFDIESGEPLFLGTSFSEEFGSVLCSLAAQDKRICAITAAMSVGTGLEEFRKRFPERFFDIGIAEEHGIPFAAGLSKQGMVPFFAVYSTFLQRCYDQLLHDGALQKQKLIIAVDRAGFVGEDGETHQGIYDAAFLNSVPDMTVYSPSDFGELREDMLLAVNQHNNIVAIRYPRANEQMLPKDYLRASGSFETYGSLDAPVVLMTYGRLFADACDARNRLIALGIEARVTKLNRIKPVDAQAIESVLGARHIFFFEEGVRSAGIGESVANMLFESDFKGKYSLTAVDDCFVAQASVVSQLHRFGLDADGMVKTVSEGLSDG